MSRRFPSQRHLKLEKNVSTIFWYVPLRNSHSNLETSKQENTRPRSCTSHLGLEKEAGLIVKIAASSSEIGMFIMSWIRMYSSILIPLFGWAAGFRLKYTALDVFQVDSSHSLSSYQPATRWTTQSGFWRSNVDRYSHTQWLIIGCIFRHSGCVSPQRLLVSLNCWGVMRRCVDRVPAKSLEATEWSKLPSSYPHSILLEISLVYSYWRPDNK